jgi:hypothetical protein
VTSLLLVVRTAELPLPLQTMVVTALLVPTIIFDVPLLIRKLV